MEQCNFMGKDKSHEKKKAYKKGVDLFERGNLEEAIEKFDEAISLDYLDVPSHVYKAKTLLMLADFKNFKKELEDLESIRPNDPNLLILKIWYYNTIKEYDNALTGILNMRCVCTPVTQKSGSRGCWFLKT